MSRYLPHTAYAEEQHLSQTILWSHVLYRGFQTGAVLGLPIATVRATILSRKAFSLAAIRATALRTTGSGALITTGLMIPGLIFRMHGREEIEWKDRSWRLLENKGQVEVDDWSLVGTVGGALAVVARGDGLRQVTSGTRALRVLGGAGTGSLLGVLGYMLWRYGVQGGKFPEKKAS